MNGIVTVIMAGGRGDRLRPLTDVRTKPAVPFGGIYRIIDFTLSNCINSELRQIYVLTQYKSYSLNNHLQTGWSFLPARLGHFIDAVPAQMQEGERWYTGTADAIRQNLARIRAHRPELVVVLSGDHIYKMDYRQMIEAHREKGAAVTLSAVRVERDVARNQFGVLECDPDGRVIGFEEKPSEPALIPGTTQCLASMGIYVFDFRALEASLANDLLDFGKDIIPLMIAQGQPVAAFDFSRDAALAEYEYITEGGRRVKTRTDRTSDSDYWRDVGTIHSYWQASMDLVAAKPSFNLYGELWPLFCSQFHFPPAKFVLEQGDRTGRALNSIVSPGVIISGSLVRESVLSPGIYIHSHSLIERSVLLGGEMWGGMRDEIQIGRNTWIRNAVIDKNVKISGDTQIGYDRQEDRRRGLTVCDVPGTGGYIVVVPKNHEM